MVALIYFLFSFIVGFIISLIVVQMLNYCDENKKIFYCVGKTLRELFSFNWVKDFIDGFRDKKELKKIKDSEKLNDKFTIIK